MNGQPTSLIEDGEEGRADHDADHEAGEDHAQGDRGAGVQDRGPEEHEDVHAGLQQRLARAQQQHLSVNRWILVKYFGKFECETRLFLLTFCLGL